MTKNLLEAMREAVAERGPDYTYPKHSPQEVYQKATDWHHAGGACRYITKETGEPACIIGLALTKMGYRPKELDHQKSAGRLMNLLGGFTDAEREAADSAQRLQDRGRTWGEALIEFEFTLKEANQNG